MNSFSAQRSLGLLHFRFGAILLLLLSLVSGTAAHAESNADQFRGTWQIDTPDNGALIIIVKRGGNASYFWGDNTDRTVYQGTWTSIDDTATLTWPDGSSHRIQHDALGFGITYTDSNSTQRYTVQAQQVPKEILGQWAKPPTKADEVTSDRDKAKGFFGIWKIGDGKDSQYVFIEADRSAASTWGSERGLRGAWAKQGSELHIAWDSGDYSILRENEHGFSYKRIEPGQIIEEDTTPFRAAIRTIEENVPSSWLADYKAERQIHTGGIAFSSRKNARAFYRGTWIVRRGENAYERIEIGRFGGLSSSRNRKTEGTWQMEGQDIFMRWDDGMRNVLSPIGQGFLLYEYKPGRPLDGVPTRILPAAPADASKLAEHLKGREDVARQILDLAEAAGIDPAEQDAGWGRTFARWVWPFGEDKTPAPDKLLEEGYDAPDDEDPWWWPFWSEKSAESNVTPAKAEEATPATGTLPEVTADMTTPAPTTTSDTAPEASDEETAPQPKKAAATRSSKKDWYWPF